MADSPGLIKGVGGYVDNATRELALQAAEVVVLPFRDGYRYNSGTLMDALSPGRPVVVSSGCLAADLAEQWGAGAVYSAGSPDSLSWALDAIDLGQTRRGMLRMHAGLSNVAVAVAHLRQLEQSFET